MKFNCAITPPSESHSDAQQETIANYEKLLKQLNRQHGIDTNIRYLILGAFGFAIWWQSHYVHYLLQSQAALSPQFRLDSSILVALIHTGLGLSGALLGILGYWFSKDGGYQKDRQRLFGIFSKNDSR